MWSSTVWEIYPPEARNSPNPLQKYNAGWQNLTNSIAVISPHIQCYMYMTLVLPLGSFQLHSTSVHAGWSGARLIPLAIQSLRQNRVAPMWPQDWQYLCYTNKLTIKWYNNWSLECNYAVQYSNINISTRLTREHVHCASSVITYWETIKNMKTNQVAKDVPNCTCAVSAIRLSSDPVDDNMHQLYIVFVGALRRKTSSSDDTKWWHVADLNWMNKLLQLIRTWQFVCPLTLWSQGVSL